MNQPGFFFFFFLQSQVHQFYSKHRVFVQKSLVKHRCVVGLENHPCVTSVCHIFLFSLHVSKKYYISVHRPRPWLLLSGRWLALPEKEALQYLLFRNVNFSIPQEVKNTRPTQASHSQLYQTVDLGFSFLWPEGNVVALLFNLGPLHLAWKEDASHQLLKYSKFLHIYDLVATHFIPAMRQPNMVAAQIYKVGSDSIQKHYFAFCEQNVSQTNLCIHECESSGCTTLKLG